MKILLILLVSIPNFFHSTNAVRKSLFILQLSFSLPKPHVSKRQPKGNTIAVQNTSDVLKSFALFLAKSMAHDDEAF